MSNKTSVLCVLDGIHHGRRFETEAILVGYEANAATILCDLPLAVEVPVHLRLEALQMPSIGAKVVANRGDSGSGYRLELKLERQWPYQVFQTLMTMTIDDPATSTSQKIPPTRCLQVLGLELPCTIERVEEAFRNQVRKVHPDRGGNVEEFVQLRTAYFEAIEMLGGSR